MSYSALIVLVLLIILVFGIKKETLENIGAESSQKMLSRLNNLRGIFAIEIVIGHVVRYENTPLFLLGKFMIISVAFYFFVSAWGIVQSWKRKSNYLKFFLISKTGYLFCLALIVYLVNVLIDICVPYSLGYYNGKDVIANFFTLTNWYIWEQIVLYILFYFIYKYIKKYRVLFLGSIVMCGIGILYHAGFSQGFYSSSLAFPLGLLFGEYYEECQRFLVTWKGKAITAATIVLGISSVFFSAESILGMVYLKNIMCIGGMLILIYVIKYFVFDNKMLRFLGRYSVEIYLIQFIFLMLFAALEWDYKVSVPAVLICTLLMSFILHPLFMIIKKKIRR